MTRRAVVVVLDGMRRDMIDQALTPHLVHFAERAQTFDGHRSMFPSATRVVSASFATGCVPARHELQGNALVLTEEGRLVHHDAGDPAFLQHKRRVTGRLRPAARVGHEDLDDLRAGLRGIRESAGREATGHGRVRPDQGPEHHSP